MATGDTKIAERDPIAGLTSILDLYSGKTTTSTTSPETTTETTKSNLTADQINSQVDMAMAPLNQASHGAGLSAYSDTTLALGRGQVAADIAAKNAGSSRTVTSSGKTITQSAPGALSSSRIGDTAQSLLTSQLLNPLIKKYATPLGSAVTDVVSRGAENIINPIADFGRSFISGGTEAAGVTVGASIPESSIVTQALDLLPTEAISSGASAVGDFISEAGDSIVQGGQDIWNYLFAAEGGPIRKGGYAEGGKVNSNNNYARGGYVDRHVSTSNVSDLSDVIGTLAANGAVDTERGKIKLVPPSTQPNEQTVGNSDPGSGKNDYSGSPDKNLGETLDAANGGKNQNTLDLNALSVIAGIVNPMLGLISSIVTGQGLKGSSFTGFIGNSMNNAEANAKASDAINNDADPLGALIGAISQTDLGEGIDVTGLPAATLDSAATALGAIGAPGSVEAAPGDGRDSLAGEGVSSDTGTMGGATGEGTSGSDEASGGHIRGPGTGTSDSIPANLSDGEYVIDAKTVEALGPEFFQAIQAHFNPAAIQSQRAKGRI